MNDFISVNSLSTEGRKEVRALLESVDDSMVRAEAERDLQKEAITNLCERLGLDPKIIRKMARTYHKANFNQEVENFNEFESFYELVMKD